MTIKNKLNNKKIGGKALISNQLNNFNSKEILIELVKQGYISNENIEEVRLKLYNKLPNRNYTNVNVPLFVKDLVCAYKSGKNNKNIQSKCKKILEDFNEDKIFDDINFQDFIENSFNNETIISCGTNNDKGNATIFYKALYEMKRHAEEQIKKEKNSSSKFGSTVLSFVKSVAKRKNISVYEKRIEKILLIYGMKSKFLDSFMKLNPINRPRNIGLNMYRETYSISSISKNNNRISYSNYGNTNNEYSNNNL